MAVTNRDLAITGVQFHPESIMTPSGQIPYEKFPG